MLFNRSGLQPNTVRFCKFILMVTLALSASSCGRHHDEEEDITESPDTIKTSVLNVGGELFSVPSPIQTAMLVQKSGIPYNKVMLNASNKVHTYSTDEMQALNLGIYGADLGYVSLYNQSQDALTYLAAIKHLSDKLGLSSAFDGPTMERIKNNIANKDSMMTMVGLAYRAGDAYLKDNQRSEISTLILTGGWLESMHFSLTAYHSSSSEKIMYRIAEQKQTLNSIIRILASGEGEYKAQIRAKLEELSKIYDEMEFKYVFEEPKTDSTKKVTYINSTTEIKVTPDQINRISEKIETIREEITGVQGTKAG